MNKIKFLYRFYINKKSGHYNWNLLFPFIGVTMGCITVSLTLAIMEGMEFVIFNKLKNTSFPAKLTHMSEKSEHEIENYLTEKNIDFIHGIETQVLIMKNGVFRLINVHGINNLNKFQKNIFGNDFQYISINSSLPEIYIGETLAYKLNIDVGDTVDIASPLELNILTGLPVARKMLVGGIYKLEILDYDQKHIFTNYSSLKNFLPDSRLLYYLPQIPNNNLSNLIKKNFPEVKIHTWEDEHHSFISAMKIEKIAYSAIGFLIVAIAGFTLMSMMSLAVIRKVPQIGILSAMGANKYNIVSIFLFQALITWMFSSIIGVIISLIIIEIDKTYHLIQLLFPGAVFFAFPLILNFEYVILIICVSFILLALSAIYPSIKASNMNTVDAIGYR